MTLNYLLYNLREYSMHDTRRELLITLDKSQILPATRLRQIVTDLVLNAYLLFSSKYSFGDILKNQANRWINVMINSWACEHKK